MNNNLMYVVSLRAAALAAELTGRGGVARALYKLADMIEAGINVDEHLAAVAEKLKSSEVSQADWDLLGTQLKVASAKLQAPVGASAPVLAAPAPAKPLPFKV